MEMYDVEALHVKQEEILKEIYKYVSGEALNKDLYSVENDLFRYVLRMGHSFLCEVIARHGTGKIEGSAKIFLTVAIRICWISGYRAQL